MALLIDSRGGVHGFNSGLIDLQPSGVTLDNDIVTAGGPCRATTQPFSRSKVIIKFVTTARRERSFPAKESRTSRSPFGQHDEKGDALAVNSLQTAN